MNITVYTQPNCPKCELVKEYLKNNDYKFKTVDITKNDEGMEYINEIGAMSTPVTKVIDGSTIHNVFGFDLVSLTDVLDEMEG